MSNRRRRQRGNMVIETLLWTPILFLLLTGMMQFGKMTYVYYQLKKVMYTAARYISVQQGANFCDLTGDPVIQNALSVALNDTADGTGSSQFPSITADQFQITLECVDSSGAIGTCDTSGCDSGTGAQRPDYITVSLPNGYQVTTHIAYILPQPILLKPAVRVPFGGM